MNDGKSNSKPIKRKLFISDTSQVPVNTEQFSEGLNKIQAEQKAKLKKKYKIIRKLSSTNDMQENMNVIPPPQARLG